MPGSWPECPDTSSCRTWRKLVEERTCAVPLLSLGSSAWVLACMSRWEEKAQFGWSIRCGATELKAEGQGCGFRDRRGQALCGGPHPAPVSPGAPCT